MFSIKIENISPDFLSYLKTESVFENGSFMFDSINNCVDVFARYFLFSIRSEAVSFYQKKLNLSDEDISDFELLISSKDSIEVLRSIKTSVSLYLQEFNVFYYDGFLNFRLSEPKKKINEIVFLSLEKIALLAVSDSNLADLKKLVSFTEQHIDKIVIDSKDNHIFVYNNNYLIFSEPSINEDFVLSELIKLNPSRIFVKEGTFSLESSEILEYVFDERSLFYSDIKELQIED